MNPRIWFAVLLFSLVTTLQAAERPEWYPDSFQLTDVYQGIEKGNRFIAGDNYFRMSPTMKVSTPDSKAVELSDITLNSKVGLKFIRIGNKALLDHVWLLSREISQSYVPENIFQLPVSPAQ